jgi:hypothetical protein
MRLLQALILRTGRGPLGWLWRASYAALARSIAAYLRHGRPDTAVYVGGSFGRGEPVPGLSDLDLIAVGPGDPEVVRRRWRRVVRRAPLVDRVAADVFVYGDDELRQAVTPAPVSGATFMREDDVHDEGGLGVRPGPFGATREWRLLAGPERRPAVALDEQALRVAAWLELQFWWRFAFQAARAPADPTVPFLCVKLIAEPARLWLWLAHGRLLFARSEVLREAAAALPQEGAAFALGLELQRDVPHRRRAPLGAALASFTRQSAGLAELMNEAAARAGADDVRLVRADGGAPPLADWRALVAPGATDERFEVVAGDPADPAVLARLGAAAEPSPALHAAPLLVRPASASARAKLRAVQCAATDPVSFAQLAGHDVARFPRLAGWSAADWARRAVAEHRAWLRHPATARLNGYGWLGTPPERARLIAAARAGMFDASIRGDEPELVLGDAAVGDRLGVDVHDAAELRQAVQGLPAYR